MRGAVVLSLLASLTATACKKQEPEPGEPALSAAPSAGATTAPRCSVGPHTFTLGERKPTGVEDGGDDVPQPFAVEVGGAVPHGDGFAVAALRSEKGGVGAVVALVGADGGSGRIVELGRTFGDAEPPRLAASSSALIAAVPDNDAGGGTLRLAAIADGKVTWGAEVEQGRDPSLVFDVELGARRGVLVWDEVEKKPERGVVRGVSFALDNLGNATQPRALSPEDDDAEAPELAQRPSGYWLAWIGRQPPEPKKKPAPAAKPAPKAAPSKEPPPDDPVVDLGRRWLRIAPLDENGALAGEPKDVTGRQAHVLVFDLAPLPDGGALLAWRDDAASPGVEGGAVHLARIAAGGSIERLQIEDDSGGAPSLIADAKKPATPSAWLALGSVTDATRLVALDVAGKALDGLDGDPAIGNAEPLALSGGRLLLARPRAMAMELSVGRCKPGAPVDGGAPAPSHEPF